MKQVITRRNDRTETTYGLFVWFVCFIVFGHGNEEQKKKKKSGGEKKWRGRVKACRRNNPKGLMK